MALNQKMITTGPNAWCAARRRVMPALGGVALFSAAVNLLMLTGSIYMLQIYDRVLSSGSVPTLMSLFAIVIVLYVFLGLFDMVRGRLLSRAAHRLDADLGQGAATMWIGGTPAKGAGPIADLDTVRGFIASQAMRGIFDLPFVPLFLAVLFVLHPWLGWLAVGGAGLTAIAALGGRLLTQKTVARGQAGTAQARQFADGARHASETSHALGMGPALVARWHGLQAGALAEAQRGADRADTIAAFSKAFRMLLQSAILTLGAWLVIDGQISAGAIIAASILSGRALAPIDQAIGQWKAIAGVREARNRLRAAFASGKAATDDATELPAPKGYLTVSRLTKLAPGNREQRLLTQVDFKLEPGDALGVIGSSASGKSSLARCLTGAWSPEMGEIRLDGATLDQWDPVRLGRHMGYLPQTVTLLPGTIRDNIARMDPETPDKTVIAAARAAGIHDMILALPKGYDTEIGAGAPPLSGGQVQRVGLARALCRQPKIVVLDEPNSNLDAEGDAALARAIGALREAGSVVIVMAHRPSAIAAVNKLLVLQDGMVVRFGARDEVLAATTRQGDAPKRAGADLRALPRREPAEPGETTATQPARTTTGAAPQTAQPSKVGVPIEAPVAEQSLAQKKPASRPLRLDNPIRTEAGSSTPGPDPLSRPVTDQNRTDLDTYDDEETGGDIDAPGREILARRAVRLRHVNRKVAS